MTTLAAVLRTPFDTWCEDYANYHTHPMNRLTHAIGIPLIMLATVRWTQFEPTGLLPWVSLVLPLYVAWNARLAIAMAVVLGVMAVVAPMIGVWGGFAAFVVGWILQFIGHAYYEKRNPAFFNNIVHVFVGPMFILRKCLSSLSA